MSKKTLYKEVQNFKTWSEVGEEFLLDAEKRAEEFFKARVEELLELYIEQGGGETGTQAAISKAEVIFDDQNTLDRASEKLKALFGLQATQKLVIMAKAEKYDRECWSEEKTKLLETATGKLNGKWYWDFDNLTESWDFKLILDDLNDRGKLVGGGRNGFYTDQPASGLIRFTVVKFAD